MKQLKQLLKEAISVSAFDKRLNPFRQLAKTGIKGPTGEYVDILELIMDWMGNRTQLSDNDFNEFMDKLKEQGYEPGNAEGSETTTPTRKKAKDIKAKEEPKKAEPKAEKGDEEEIEANPEDFTVEEPPSSPEPEKAKEEPAKPYIPGKSEKPSDKIPSLSSLAGKEGVPPPMPKSGEKQKEKSSNELPDLPGASKKDMPSMKDLSKEKEKKKAKPLTQKEKDWQKKQSQKDIDIGVDVDKVNTQEWEVGKKVRIGFIKDPFKIVGGSREKGWLLVDPYGRDYVFYPSKHPDPRRGIRRVK